VLENAAGETQETLWVRITGDTTEGGRPRGGRLVLIPTQASFTRSILIRVLDGSAYNRKSVHPSAMLQRDGVNARPCPQRAGIAQTRRRS